MDQFYIWCRGDATFLHDFLQSWICCEGLDLSYIFNHKGNINFVGIVNTTVYTDEMHSGFFPGCGIGIKDRPPFVIISYGVTNDYGVEWNCRSGRCFGGIHLGSKTVSGSCRIAATASPFAGKQKNCDAHEHTGLNNGLCWFHNGRIKYWPTLFGFQLPRLLTMISLQKRPCPP